MEDSARILVIEDDVDINDVVAASLRKTGYVCVQAFSGSEARLLLKTAAAEGEAPFDLVITDLMLPGASGEELVRAIRANSDAPVIVVSARSDAADKVALLKLGADDYLTKPFALLEVEARLLALIQRAKGSTVDTVRVFGDLSYDTRSRVVSIGGKPVHLTRKAIIILEALLRDPGRVVSREELESQLWGSEPPSSDALRSQVHLLRRALADAGFDGIETMHGTGWRLVTGERGA